MAGRYVDCMTVLFYLFRALVVGSLCVLVAGLAFGALASLRDYRENELDALTDGFEASEHRYPSEAR